MTAAFSFQTRAENIRRQAAQHWDVLVIGGGITGVSIARDAALRGFRVALLEKGDFASGTSSKSSRMAHGGIRYLEKMELPLVFEALRERDTWRRIAPHLVRPAPTLYPVFRGGHISLPKLEAGMWLYDALARFRNFRLHQPATAARLRAWVPTIRQDGLQGGAAYYDAFGHDARLTLAIAQSAHRAGAALVTYAQAAQLLKENGRIVGVQAQDTLADGVAWEVRARTVINATGVWADQLMQQDEPHGERHLRPSKGVHIVVPRDRFRHDHVVVFFSPRDDRILFLIPWGEQTIIGTTDTAYDGDLDGVHATADDVAYILDAVRATFPDVRLTAADILSTYAGLRPLVVRPGASNTYQLSREHQIFASPSGLITISGGKWTTARAMAQQVVDVAEARLKTLGIYPIGPCCTHREPLDPASLSELRHLADGRRRGATLSGPSPDRVEHMIGRYGSEYRTVLRWMRDDAALAAPIVAGLPYTWADVRFAIEHEMALTLADLLSRRIPLLHETRSQGLDVAPAVADFMAQRLGWPAATRDAHLHQYRNEVRLSRLYQEEGGVAGHTP